jgi:hypothetical protein
MTVAEEVTTDFARAYFNYDYKRAQQYITPESKKWLRFAATNVTQQTLDLLNQRSEEKQTDVCLESSEVLNDSTQMVSVSVTNYVDTDSLGQQPFVREEAVYRMKVVCRDDKWMVRMEGLPRSERRSRD